MEFGTPYFFVAALVTLLIGISKSGLAGGGSSLGVPLLSMFVSPIVAAGILLPILILIDGTNLWNYRHNFHRRFLALLLPGAVFGIAVGSLVFTAINPAHLKLIIALIALWFSALYFLRRYLRSATKPLARKWALILGAVGGFTSHLAHAGGPPVRVFLLSQGIDKTLYVGTMGFLFAAINVIKLGPYVALGQINSETLWASLMIIGFVPLGVFLGLRLHRLISQDAFMLLSHILLAMAGVKLAIDGTLALI